MRKKIARNVTLTVDDLLLWLSARNGRSDASDLLVVVEDGNTEDAVDLVREALAVLEETSGL